MENPFRREIGQVFIPVRDVHVAAPWYAELLGTEVAAPTHDATIVDIPMQSGPGLSLDANAPFTADGPPRFFWWADDMGSVLAHLERLGIDVVRGPLDIGSVELLHFRDLDGNLLMVCVPTGPGPRP
ncbi:VOC family protein [Brachybacterium paraconglomeratum]|uniref:VOC family protein n=1 Tax=Brachybacterium paraconglomeratum TaxID=173362 RepID=UPI0022DFCAB5|nr:VOC family protein [Brachybacterium paraconglomeratum]